MDEWDVSLDEQPGDAVRAPRPGLLALLTVAAGVVLAVGFLVWRPHLPEPAPAVSTVLGERLVAPVHFTTPAGTVAVANRDYVGLRDARGGSMLVTVPSEVVQPGGRRATLPADPVRWLEQHPDVFVSRVREVTVAGEKVTQLDYRRSRNAQPQSDFARLPLFCASDTDCTRITAGARVRATFVPVGGRLVLVEAVWRPDGTSYAAGWRMPDGLRQAYAQLLASLRPTSS